MKKSLIKLTTTLCLIAMGGSAFAATKHINGAGSSFIYPVMSQWTTQYHKLTGIEVNYQPIGSGGGLQQIYAKTVNFAASDMPLDSKLLNQKKLIQFPMIIGGIVPIVNITGIHNNQLILSGPILAQIYQNKIHYWNNPNIAKLNPNLTLPHTRIVTIHRADGSGTTYNFTNYLAKISPNWQKTVGSNTIVNWPGFGIGAKGDAGVVAQVSHVPNAIGYVEYAYATENHLNMTKMINRNGKVVIADAETFAHAAQHANYQAKNNFNLILTDQSGDKSWPIVATTFILMPKNGKQPVRQAEYAFFKWCYQHGKSMATQLDYVALPKTVYQKVMHSWHNS